MKLYAVRILVRDWDSAVGFYRDTLGLTQKFADESMGWAEFDVGGPVLGVERAEGDDELVGRFVGASLQVDDIDGICQRLMDLGVHFVSPPEKQPWGGTLAHFADPEGNVLTLLG